MVSCFQWSGKVRAKLRTNVSSHIPLGTNQILILIHILGHSKVVEHDLRNRTGNISLQFVHISPLKIRIRVNGTKIRLLQLCTYLSHIDLDRSVNDDEADQLVTSWCSQTSQVVVVSKALILIFKLFQESVDIERNVFKRFFIGCEPGVNSYFPPKSAVYIHFYDS